MSDYQFLKLINEYNAKTKNDSSSIKFSLPQTIMAIFDRGIKGGFDSKISKEELANVSKEDYQNHVKDIKKYASEQGQELGYIPNIEELKKLVSDGGISKMELEISTFNPFPKAKKTSSQDGTRINNTIPVYETNKSIDVKKLSKKQYQIALERGLLLNLDGREKQFDIHDIIELTKLRDYNFKIAENRGLLKDIEGREKQFNGEEISILAKLNNDKFKIAKKRGLLKDIKGRKEQLVGSDISELMKLTDEEFKVAKKRGLLKDIEGREEQLGGSDISELTKLTGEEFKKAEQLLYIEGREYQFNSEGVCKLAKLTNEEFKRAEQLFYFEEREYQFNSEGVWKIAKLTDEEFKKAEQLLYIEGREYQFNSEDVCKLAKLTDEEFKRAEQLLYIEGREYQFNSKDISKLAKLTDEEFKKAEQLLYIEENRCYFNTKDIIELVKLTNDELKLAKERGLLKDIEGREYQFKGVDIIDLVKLTDDRFKIAKERRLLKNIEGREFNGEDIVKLTKLSNKQFQKAKDYFIDSNTKFFVSPKNDLIISSKIGESLFGAVVINKNGGLEKKYGIKKTNIHYHYDYFDTKTKEYMINKIENGAIKQDISVKSPLGTTTKRNTQYEKNGSFETELSIKDKNGKNILERKVNHKINEDNATTIIENNNEIKEYKVEGLNSDILTITKPDSEKITLDLVELCEKIKYKTERKEIKKTIKKLPVNALIELKNEVNKVYFDNNPGFSPFRNNIYLNEGNFIDAMLHELAHAQDWVYFDKTLQLSLSTSETFKEVFEKEFEVFNKNASNAERDIIEYLTSVKKEIFAESKMLLNTRELVADKQSNLTGRQLLLLKYFPETMAKVQEISTNQNRFDGKKQRTPLEKL